ncbi:undecaprenyldiphospho-muramoylpentapeptide beta-N-acetylglucosaminyltransferase [Desertibacillus haloalkaliphilus]|uniref:undecaprenyldiphospho-muramoylpentapeptide beta-N-acetylglucosaminyltransferase n=1 Tax=Desertibacillus haloalkaliphilus TaxID=1328930 RepID=UPI001C267BB4|nr:undecaprenyldiphospho-muramoylpentapeptide beta-N-acetylglucosaminyltransferase [Desertibacillus haloalkaliphilus]MBU8907109.1 undecaprenyldiphospho-muramoylpentapeptide beta-N-acetylglucosaminyltransferase [Desertibacillus haloalkaliphilus]
MRVIISGGGTGGHIYPALSLVKEIKKTNEHADLLYIGTENGLESKIVPREGIPFKTITISGFRRKLSVENVKTIYRFLKGVRDAKKMIKDFRPDVVVGTGGYVCGPVVYAAAKLNIPTIIHEQNSVPGLTNKFLSRYVDKVAISFSESTRYFPQEKVVYTGNPRATEVIDTDGERGRASVGLADGKKTVLIVGGSRGARPINEAFLEVLPEAKIRDYQFLYVTGDVHYDSVMNEVKKQGNPENVLIRPFIHNMPEVLAGVDLVVARAGATSLAEITALGIPSILIPSPYVTNNHQEKNAQALRKEGAAYVRLEQEMNGEKLMKDIDEILTTNGKWEEMHQSSQSLGMPRAAQDLYGLMKELSN